LSTSAAFQSPFTSPILLVDPDVDLGRGLLHQLTRHGFCADLAITVHAARACVGVRYYRATVVVADLSDCQHLFGLRQLRKAAPQTWIIVVATKTEFEACQVVFSHGGTRVCRNHSNSRICFFDLSPCRTSSVRCNRLRSLSEAIHVDPRDNPRFIQKARSVESLWRAVTLARIRPRSNRPT
jgi:hypothetical protein